MIKSQRTYQEYTCSFTETEMSSFWRNFHHWLHWKLSFWQLSVQPVMKISSKWRHFPFSVMLVFGLISVSIIHILLGYFTGTGTIAPVLMKQPWRMNHQYMMTSSNGNILRITSPLCREFTSHRWISRTKASDTELWCFLWSASK